MRRLNISFIAYLILALLAVGGGVHLLWAINVGKSTDLVLDKAKAALERGDLREALGLYAEYLDRNPDDTEHICHAALAAADITEQEDIKPQDVKFAYQLMERALRKAPQRQDVRKRLIELLVRVGGFDEARKHFQKMDKSERDAELGYLDAVCAFRTGNDAEAMARLESLVGFNSISKRFIRREAEAPEMFKAYMLLANLIMLRKDDPAAADAVVHQMVAANPDDAEAYLQRGRFLRQFNRGGTNKDREARAEAAKDDLRRALQLDPEGVDALLENALMAMSDKQYDGAAEYLITAVEKHPDDHRVYIQQARLAALQNDYAAAVRHYEEGLQRIPDNRELLFYLFEAQLRAKDVDSALASIEKMKKLKFPAERIVLAEAQIPLAQEKWQEALRKFEEIRPQVAPIRGLAEAVDTYLARCYERLGQPDKQYEAYKRVLAVNPRSEVAVRGLISAHLQLQQHKQAFALLQDLRKTMGEEAFAADKNLVSNYYRVVTVLGRQKPDSRQYKRLAAELRTMLAQGEQADAINATLLEADALLRDEKIDEARRKLAAALKETPEDTRLQRGYLRLIIQQDGPQAGLRLIDAALAASNIQRRWQDTAQLRLVRADLLTKVGDPDAKAKIAALAKDIDKFSTTEQALIWRGVGAAYYNLPPRDYDQVRRCWERALELDPANLGVRELLFELTREQGDDVGMLGLLDDVQQMEGKNGILWPYFRARYLLWTVQRGQADATALDDASRLAEQVARRRPGWYVIAKLDAEINDLQGNTEEAMAQYRRALQLGPADARIVRRLAELLMAKGQYAEARKFMNLMGKTPAGMERHKVVLEALGGDEAKAVAALAAAVRDDSRNAGDFLWKGQILNRLKQPAEAEKAFRKAVQLAPSVPQTWLVLVEHLVRAGKPREAEATVRQAESQLSEDRVALTLAQSYALLGNNNLAEQYYRTALSATPDNLSVLRAVATYYIGVGQSARATPYLKTILRETDRTGRSLSSHAVWARRALAPILAGQGDYPSFRKALAVLEANQSGGKLSATDQRIKVSLLSKRPEPGFQQEAMELLESLHETKGTLTLDERLSLAVLFDKSDRWRECRELMLTLYGESGQEPRLLATFSQMLLDHYETAQAENWIGKLRRVEPNSQRTLALRARLHLQRQEEDDAVDLVNSIVPEPSAKDYEQRLLIAARMLEELELYRDAEDNYRKFGKLKPANKLALASFLMRRGQLDTLVDVCQEIKSPSTLGAICDIAGVALEMYPDRLTGAQIKQIEDWISEAELRFPDAAVLQVRRVALLIAQDRFAEAEYLADGIMQGDIPETQYAVLANNLAYQRTVRGRADQKTMDLVEAALRILGPLQEVLDTRAVVHIARGNCSEAVRDLQAATIFGDATGALYYHLALAYQCSDDPAKARAALVEAEKMGFSREALRGHERKRLDALTAWLR